MKKIIVTGGCGFVGRHLIRRLLLDGHRVHCVDNLRMNTGAIHPADGWFGIEPKEFINFRFFQRDCRDYFHKFKDDDYDYAFHLAAVVGGRMMLEKQPLAVADDLSIDSHFWQWAERTKPKKIIAFSSSAAYPIHMQTKDNHQLLHENLIDLRGTDLGIPDLSYGWSKLTLEFLSKLAYERHGLKSVIFRPFSGYGEDQDSAYPFPSLIEKVAIDKGSFKVAVWGSGEQMRDWIHIEDCIDGILKIMDKVDDANAVNLSTGISTSFKDFIGMAAEVVGYHAEVVPDLKKPEEVFARVGSTTKQNSFGFKAKISLEEGIRMALEYRGLKRANKKEFR